MLCYRLKCSIFLLTVVKDYVLSNLKRFVVLTTQLFKDIKNGCMTNFDNSRTIINPYLLKSACDVKNSDLS